MGMSQRLWNSLRQNKEVLGETAERLLRMEAVAKEFREQHENINTRGLLSPPLPSYNP